MVDFDLAPGSPFSRVPHSESKQQLHRVNPKTMEGEPTTARCRWESQLVDVQLTVARRWRTRGASMYLLQAPAHGLKHSDESVLRTIKNCAAQAPEGDW